MSPSPFGTLLRAARLGYQHIKSLDAFMRIDASGPPWRVSVVREAKDMTAGPRDLFVCWREGDPTGERMMAQSPALKALRSEDIPTILWLDDDGKRTEPPCAT